MISFYCLIKNLGRYFVRAARSTSSITFMPLISWILLSISYGVIIVSFGGHFLFEVTICDIKHKCTFKIA